MWVQWLDVCSRDASHLLPSLIPGLSQQHDLVRAACAGMALQDAAGGGNNLAGGKRDEAQPQPDWDGQGDLGRWCGAGAGAACVCAWSGIVPHWSTPRVEGPFEKHSVLPRICQQKSKGSPLLQPVRLGPAAVAQISAQLGRPFCPSPSQGYGDGDRALMGWVHPLNCSPSQGCGDGDGVLAGRVLGARVVVGEGLALFAHALALCRTSSSSAGPMSKRRDPPSPSSWTCWRNCQSATVAFPTLGTSGSRRSKSLPLLVLACASRQLCLRSPRPRCHS